MKALDMSREETLSRGNYSRNYVMIATVYNHDASGKGPCAAMSSSVGKALGREEVLKKLPLPYDR